MMYFEALFLAPPRLVVAYVIIFNFFLGRFARIFGATPGIKFHSLSRQNRHLTGFPSETSCLDGKMEV